MEDLYFIGPSFIFIFHLRTISKLYQNIWSPRNPQPSGGTARL